MAYFRTIAMLQVYDMADRIRANKSGAEAGAYNSLSGAPDDPGCIATGCTAAEMAAYDAFDWNSTSASLLPLGQGTVTGDGTDFTVTVMWDGNKSGATGTGCDPANAADMLCFRMSIRP